MTSRRTETAHGEKKVERAFRAALLGMSLWLAPFSLVQNETPALAVLSLVLAIVVALAGLTRFPAATAIWMGRKVSQRSLAFWSLWFSGSGLLLSLLVGGLPAMVIVAGMPMPGVYWAIIGGGVASLVINVWVLVANLAMRDHP